MKEAIWIEINGKRIGCTADRKKKEVFIDAKAADYSNIGTVQVEGEAFKVKYTIPEQTPGYCNMCGNYDCFCH